MNYTRLSLVEIRSMLQDVARDARATFGGLDARQLNWRPDAARWSVAQCFQHLLTSNDLVLRAAEDALRNPAKTTWRRVLLPRLTGWMLIRSQAPTTTRKFTAPTKAQPTSSEIPADVLERFVAQHHDADEWIGTLVEPVAARAIMISPFIRFAAYSVLDACRLIVAHDRRHVEQARRVVLSPEFPRPHAMTSEVT
jgi:hypothetical protein